MIKANFNATLSQAEARSGFSVMIHDHDSKILTFGQFLHSNVNSAFAAEGLASFNAVQMSAGLGFSSVIIEGDAKTIIKKCKFESRDRSLI